MSNIIIGAADPNKRIKDIKDAEFVDIQAGIRYRQTRAPEGNTWNVVERDVKTYIPNTAGSAVWGSITGSITSQTDLKNALDNKQNITISGYSLGTVTPVDNGQTVTQAFGNVQAQINNINTVAAGKLDGNLTAGRIPFATGPKTLSDTANVTWDNTLNILGVTQTINVTGEIPVVSLISSGLDNLTLQVNSGNNVELSSNLPIFLNSGAGMFSLSEIDGSVTIDNLSGVGTRYVTVNSAGTLIPVSLPSDLVTGSAASTQVTYWTGTQTQAGSNNFRWGATANTLDIIGKQTITYSTAGNSLTLVNNATSGTKYGLHSTVTGAGTENIAALFTATGGTINHAIKSIAGLNYFAGATYVGADLSAAAKTSIGGNLTVASLSPNSSIFNLYTTTTSSSRESMIKWWSSTSNVATIGYNNSSTFVISLLSPLLITPGQDDSVTITNGYSSGHANYKYFQLVAATGELYYKGSSSVTPQWKLSATLNSYTGATTLGTNAIVNNNAVLNILREITVTGQERNVFDSRLNITANIGVTWAGNQNNLITVNATSGVNGVSTLTGIYNEVLFASGNIKNVGTLYLNRSVITGTGSTGNITIGYGHKVETVAITATTFYGLHLDIQGTIGTGWGIYQLNTNITGNYFGSPILVGTTTTGSQMMLKGSTANILEVLTSANLTKFKITDTAWTINLGSDATGDLYYRDSSGNFVRLPIGTSGQTLKVSAGGIPEWV